MRTSIATVSLSGDLRSKLTAIAQAGFRGIELFEQDLLTFDGSTKVVSGLIKDLGLELVAFQPFRDFEGMPEPQRTQNFFRAEKKFDLMQQLGTDLMLVCSNVSPLALGGLDRAAEDFFALGELAAKRGLRVGFEALAWGKHISDYRDAWEVVRRANHAAIGTILDTFHILAKGLEVQSIESIPKEKIFLVQVADAPSLEMGVVPWSRHYRNFPGQGRLPLSAFMKSLAATRYDGYYSLEIFNDQFRAAPPRQTALDGFRSLVYLQETASQTVQTHAVGAAQTHAVGAAQTHAVGAVQTHAVGAAQTHAVGAVQTHTVGAVQTHAVGAVQTHGVGFVEFAVGNRVASELSDLFSQIGFRKIGQHRSKNVSLWRQGQAQLIINAENAGFALEYKAQHGSSVCAVALQVSSVEAAKERAANFKYQILEPEVRHGEHQIPAILGTDGSLIYLLEHGRSNDDFWNVDFVLTTSSPTSDFVIDHVGQVLPFSQSLSWLLFYRSIFAVQASNLTNIPDPSGLITSQVVENTERSLRFVLNASQYAGTLAAKYLAGHAGGGVQHIAFASTDIFATLEIWQAAGVKLLEISTNYYTDLQARYGFSDDFINQMQRLGVMYDTDATGEFFHAYTQTFADFFFFEICQRRGSRESTASPALYDGYGAVNAAVRVAAQTRAGGTHD